LRSSGVRKIALRVRIIAVRGLWTIHRKKGTGNRNKGRPQVASGAAELAERARHKVADVAGPPALHLFEYSTTCEYKIQRKPHNMHERFCAPMQLTGGGSTCMLRPACNRIMYHSKRRAIRVR